MSTGNILDNGIHREKVLSDHHLIALYSSRKRLSKTLIRSVEKEMQQRAIDPLNAEQYSSEIKPYVNTPLSLKHKMLIIFTGPLIFPVPGVVAANIEGKGYARKARSLWLCLMTGYVFYLLIITGVTIAARK